jgi:hypothetical protein
LPFPIAAQSVRTKQSMPALVVASIGCLFDTAVQASL